MDRRYKSKEDHDQGSPNPGLLSAQVLSSALKLSILILHSQKVVPATVHPCVRVIYSARSIFPSLSPAFPSGNPSLGPVGPRSLTRARLPVGTLSEHHFPGVGVALPRVSEDHITSLRVRAGLLQLLESSLTPAPNPSPGGTWSVASARASSSAPVLWSRVILINNLPQGVVLSLRNPPDLPQDLS